ncbi:MAG: hypothetical protein LIP00_09950 [Parabacteroides sp.]|nr:hypothetical protein [Parabacteroides sp.]
MKHIQELHFLIGALFMVAFLPVSAQQRGEAVLAKAAQAYAESGGITAQFTTVISSSRQQASEKIIGIIDMQGEKFKLITPDMHTFFDGATQWVYMKEADEVNVSTPSGDDLLLLNPALLLKNYQSGFRIVKQSEATGRNGKPVYEIELVPLKKKDITHIILQLDKGTFLPAGIRVFSKGDIITSVYITDIKKGVNQPGSFFVFKEADYPNAEIIDLR